jgi:hypothetical protein
VQIVHRGSGSTEARLAAELEGSTWYRLDISPTAYWRLWANGIVRAIHRQVLDHIKRVTELES